VYDKEVRKFAEEQEKKISLLDKEREHLSNNIIEKKRERNDSDRDYARILYSSSFRRLQGKMQLLEIDPIKFSRNRLTHSLEVAQIARVIACDLKIKNPIAVELAALAHDIGNPPFGHSGEKKLDDLSSKIGGFEGNAQTLRILRKLEKKHTYCDGLNLTYRSLLSIIKYPNKKEGDKNKFIYDEDYIFYQCTLKKFNIFLKPGEKTIDAQILDLADEIAYAAHDLEDALSCGLVNIEDIYYEFRISDEYNPALKDFRKLVSNSWKVASRAYKLESSEEFSIIFRKELTSNIVNKLCKDINIIDNENGFEELGFKSHKKLSEGLKKLLFNVIKRKRNILEYESKGDRVISDLFEFYKENIDFLPPELKSHLEDKTKDDYESKKDRAIVDYISGMMDTFAIKEWETHCQK
ncbi:deoxyguanosinetriphosphate triphosphohydrolase family protein, partial [Serratia symbiotica]|uniref:deoxyguanosinetriphosphate triphosphohydrolase family protein n=1 Tax=Serratia symbiotica TaxID=138074 RepID=UPI001FFDC5E0